MKRKLTPFTPFKRRDIYRLTGPDFSFSVSSRGLAQIAKFIGQVGTALALFAECWRWLFS